MHPDYQMIGKLAGALVVAEFKIMDIHNWTVTLAKGEKYVPIPDILEALEEWGVAASIFHFIREKDKETQAKIWSVRPDLSADKLWEKLAELQGYINSIDTTDTALFEATIDRQLELELERWQSYVAAVRPQDLEDDIDDYLTKMSMGRDSLEYAAIAIEIIQAEYPYFRRLKNLFKFLKGLEETDVRFKQILGDRRDQVYHWADPVLWWRKPAKR